MELIIGRTIPYRPQWDNAIDPSGTCNVTSMVNALEVGNFEFQAPEGMQPEDYLATLLETKEAYSIMARLYKWAVGSYKPRHVHGMLSWAVNEKLVGTPVTFFTERAHMREIIYHMVATRTAVVTSGRFTPYGHVVTIVGFASSQDDILMATAPQDIKLSHISHIIVNDPWGNYFTGYRDKNGFNVRFPYHTFVGLANTPGKEDRKYAHFFYRGSIPRYLEHLV